MKKYLLITLMAIALSAAAQQTPTNKTRSNGDYSQVDNYLIGLKRLGIPTSETDNLDAAGLPQNTVKLIYNTTLGRLRIYNPVAGTWADATAVDLTSYYKKDEVDALFVQNKNISDSYQSGGFAVSTGKVQQLAVNTHEPAGNLHVRGTTFLDASITGGVSFYGVAENNNGGISTGSALQDIIDETNYSIVVKDNSNNGLLKALPKLTYLPSTGGTLTGNLGLSTGYLNVSHPDVPGYGARLDWSQFLITNGETGNYIQIKGDPTNQYIGYSRGPNILKLYAPTLTDARDITYPDKSGVLSVTSDLDNYLSLTGGTITGNLSMSKTDAIDLTLTNLTSGFQTNLSDRRLNIGNAIDLNTFGLSDYGRLTYPSDGTFDIQGGASGGINFKGNEIRRKLDNARTLFEGDALLSTGGALTGNLQLEAQLIIGYSSNPDVGQLSSYIDTRCAGWVFDDKNGNVNQIRYQPNLYGNGRFHTNLGELAVLSDLDPYLPLTGGTVTGNLDIKDGNITLGYASDASYSTTIAPFGITSKVGDSQISISGGEQRIRFSAPSGAVKNLLYGSSAVDEVNLNLPSIGGTIMTEEKSALNYLSLTGGNLTGDVSTTNDIEISDLTKGVILKSPDGARWRITISNAGVLTTTAL